MPSIDILGGTMHYEDRGEGFPIIFLHGFGLDHRNGLGMLEPVFAGRQGWRRLYPDMPGAGKTRLDAHAVSADEYLHVVEAFIDIVIPGQRFAVVGQSYGGYIARGLLLRRLNSVAGIALVVPCVILDRTKRHVAPFRVMEEEDGVLAKLDPKDQAEIRESLVVIHERSVARFQAEILAAVRDANMPLLERMQAIAYAFSFDLDASLPVVTCPALILTGRMDDVVGFADSFSLLHKFPRATHVVLDKAGHSLELDQEQVVTRILGDWFDRVSREEGLD
jgi:pimeloyl-ACP methyl ester carboxylesterase